MRGRPRPGSLQQQPRVQFCDLPEDLQQRIVGSLSLKER